MTELFLNWMAGHGLVVLVAVLLAQPLGLPLPAGLLLVAAGASARLGLLDARGAAAVCLVAAVAGDCATYALGRAVGEWARPRLPGRLAALWQRAELQLASRGSLAIYLTRVVLTPLELATNLAAGSARFPLLRFAAWAAAGRATWIGLYGAVGYLSGSRWPAAWQVLGQYGRWAAALMGGAALLSLARTLRKGRHAGAGWM